MPGIREEGRRHLGLRSRHSPTSISECSQPACEVFCQQSSGQWVLCGIGELIFQLYAVASLQASCISQKIIWSQIWRYIYIWPTLESIKSILKSYFNYLIKLIKLVVRCPSDHIRASPKLHQCPLDYSFGSWESYTANLLLGQAFEWYNYANTKTNIQIGIKRYF